RKHGHAGGITVDRGAGSEPETAKLRMSGRGALQGEQSINGGCGSASGRACEHDDRPCLAEYARPLTNSTVGKHSCSQFGLEGARVALTDLQYERKLGTTAFVT